jgi:hypothetical protein
MWAMHLFFGRRQMPETPVKAAALDRFEVGY